MSSIISYKNVANVTCGLTAEATGVSYANYEGKTFPIDFYFL